MKTVMKKIFSLMLVAAVVSLTIFCIQGAPEQKGGAKK